MGMDTPLSLYRCSCSCRIAWQDMRASLFPRWKNISSGHTGNFVPVVALGGARCLSRYEVRLVFAYCMG